MLIQEYKSETTILFNELKVMLHVVHHVPGTGRSRNEPKGFVRAHKITDRKNNNKSNL